MAAASYGHRPGAANGRKTRGMGLYYGVISGRGAAIARVTENGALDPSFDGDGRCYTGRRDAVAIQPDGKIVIAGYSSGAAVSRVNEDGTRRRHVRIRRLGARTGQRRLALGSIVVQADGKIVATGTQIPRSR